MVSPSKPTTARFCLYKLISIGVLKSTAQYEKLLGILRDARVRGDIDDDCFIDSKRTVSKLTTWKSVEEFREDTRDWYDKDYWADQTKYPIILVEKGTVGLVLGCTCREYQ